MEQNHDASAGHSCAAAGPGTKCVKGRKREVMASIAAAVAAGDLTAAEAAELAKVVDVYVRALDSKGFQ
jgi:hypothetical protein